jgi:hypothetical protein
MWEVTEAMDTAALFQKSTTWAGELVQMSRWTGRVTNFSPISDLGRELEVRFDSKDDSSELRPTL